MQLAIDVGFGHMVEVDQRQRPDAATGKRLRRPGSHAAQPHDAYMGGGEAPGTALAVHPCHAAEAAPEIRIFFCHRFTRSAPDTGVFSGRHDGSATMVSGYAAGAGAHSPGRPGTIKAGRIASWN